MFKAAKSIQQLKQPLTKSPSGYHKKVVPATLLTALPATIQATIRPKLGGSRFKPTVALTITG